MDPKEKMAAKRYKGRTIFNAVKGALIHEGVRTPIRVENNLFDHDIPFLLFCFTVLEES